MIFVQLKRISVHGSKEKFPPQRWNEDGEIKKSPGTASPESLSFKFRGSKTEYPLLLAVSATIEWVKSVESNRLHDGRRTPCGLSKCASSSRSDSRHGRLERRNETIRPITTKILVHNASYHSQHHSHLIFPYTILHSVPKHYSIQDQNGYRLSSVVSRKPRHPDGSIGRQIYPDQQTSIASATA